MALSMELHFPVGALPTFLLLLSRDSAPCTRLETPLALGPSHTPLT